MEPRIGFFAELRSVELRRYDDFAVPVSRDVKVLLGRSSRTCEHEHNKDCSLLNRVIKRQPLWENQRGQRNGTLLHIVGWLAVISNWLAAHGLAVEAGASAVSAILAAVLVWTTIKYARGTARILEESRMARLAAEAQAASAQRSVELLRQQLEEQLGLGRSVIQSTIASAMSAIAYWKEQDLKSLAKVRGLPSTDSLVPGNALSSVDYARRISPEAAQELSAAFDDLRHARNEIDSMKQVEAITGQGTSFFDLTSDQAERFLESASVRIQKVLGLIPLRPTDLIRG